VWLNPSGACAISPTILLRTRPPSVRFASPTNYGNREYVLPAGLRRVWQRHDFETMAKRLKALEAKSEYSELLVQDARS
jgi:hypothetical protein